MSLNGSAQPVRADLLVGLGRVQLATGQPQAALAPLQEADAFWREFDGANRWAGEAALWLARGQLAAGLAREGRDNLARARAILSRSALDYDRKLLESAGGIGPSRLGPP